MKIEGRLGERWEKRVGASARRLCSWIDDLKRNPEVRQGVGAVAESKRHFLIL